MQIIMDFPLLLLLTLQGHMQTSSQRNLAKYVNNVDPFKSSVMVIHSGCN